MNHPIRRLVLSEFDAFIAVDGMIFTKVYLLFKDPLEATYLIAKFPSAEVCTTLPNIDDFDRSETTLLICDDNLFKTVPLETFWIRSRGKNISCVCIKKNNSIPRIIRLNSFWLIYGENYRPRPRH